MKITIYVTLYIFELIVPNAKNFSPDPFIISLDLSGGQGSGTMNDSKL